MKSPACALAITEAGKNSLASTDDLLLGRKTKMGFALRPATVRDADAVANAYYTSFRLLNFLPMLHTIEEYQWFISNVTLRECEVTVAEDETGIVAFLARRG